METIDSIDYIYYLRIIFVLFTTAIKANNVNEKNNPVGIVSWRDIMKVLSNKIEKNSNLNLKLNLDKCFFILTYAFILISFFDNLR